MDYAPNITSSERIIFEPLTRRTAFYSSLSRFQWTIRFFLYYSSHLIILPFYYFLMRGSSMRIPLYFYQLASASVCATGAGVFGASFAITEL